MESLKDIIELCFIPRLSKNYDECQNHVEFENRDQNLDKYFNILLKKLEIINVKDINNSEYNIVSHLIILYYELSSNTTWNTEKYSKLSEKLNYYFQVFHKINITDVLKENEIFDHQQVFDNCLKILHNKLNSNDFKRYPGQIEVYCNIFKDIEEYNVAMLPSRVLPAALYLTEDYIIENKIKGLKCTLLILKCLSIEDFEQGNYYDVIYLTLKKILSEKDVEATKLAFKCFFILYNIFPVNVKKAKLDEIYDSALEQLVIESNLYRKAEYLNFTRTIISMHKIHCVNRSIFLTIIADNLELCCNETVSDLLLDNVLQTLKEWIKYCWCVWKLRRAEHKVLSKLFKVLYTCKEDHLSDVHNLIITLINLCTEPEKKNIINNLNNVDCSIDKTFLNRIRAIKNNITYHMFYLIHYMKLKYLYIKRYKRLKIAYKNKLFIVHYY